MEADGNMIDFRDEGSYSAEIMVVDDNPANLKLLTDILSAEGYKVRPVNGGALALLSVAAKAPDLVLLDIKMPDMDGYEVCRRLKREDGSAEIPVIFITALDDVEEKIKGFNLGAVDYINKPFQPKEVVARVKNYLKIKTMQLQLEKINSALEAEIVERKSIEESLFKEQEEVAFANAASIAKSQFLANMSHEIRIPMNGFIGMIQVMEMTQLTAEQREYMNIIRTSSDALLKLINDILDYTKIEIGKIKLEKTSFNFRKMIYDVVCLFKPSAERKGLMMEVSIEKDLPDHFIGDPFRLRQILSNLMGNAVKFTNKGRITISIVRVEEWSDKGIKLKFIVKDTGIGIPDNEIDILFERFSQADNYSTRKYGGNGLGLAISQKLVELMAGEIWVESREGEGSSFCFTCMLESLEMKKGFTESTKPKQVEAPGEYELKILLAEDDRVSQMVLEQLARRKGWQVTSCGDGTEAFDTYRQQKFDIVIMDCQMPVLDGYKATRAIRQLESQRGTHIPIIAMTAYALKGDKEKCIDAGMDDYLTKPINAHDFYTTVEKWTKGKNE